MSMERSKIRRRNQALSVVEEVFGPLNIRPSTETLEFWGFHSKEAAKDEPEAKVKPKKKKKSPR